MKVTTCQLAIIQDSPVFLNLAASVERACKLIKKAASDGANVIVFPETWLPGYPVWLDFSPNAALWDYDPAKALFCLLVENSPEIPGKYCDQLAAAARRYRVFVVMGLHEKYKRSLYNTILYLRPEGDVAIHRKLMPTYTERLIWARGDGSTLPVMKSAYGNIGGLICWEHWMPLARAAMHAKQEHIHIAQWPMVKETNLLASRHYAFEGQCFVAAAGCVLSKKEMLEGAKSAGATEAAMSLLKEMPVKPETLLLKGGSAIIAPDATCIVGPVWEKSTILQAEIDLRHIREGQLFMDSDGHYSRPDVFQLTVNEAKQDNVHFKQGF